MPFIVLMYSSCPSVESSPGLEPATLHLLRLQPTPDSGPLRPKNLHYFEIREIPVLRLVAQSHGLLFFVGIIGEIICMEIFVSCALFDIKLHEISEGFKFSSTSDNLRLVFTVKYHFRRSDDVHHAFQEMEYFIPNLINCNVRNYKLFSFCES